MARHDLLIPQENATSFINVIIYRVLLQQTNLFFIICVCFCLFYLLIYFLCFDLCMIMTFVVLEFKYSVVVKIILLTLFNAESLIDILIRCSESGFKLLDC